MNDIKVNSNIIFYSHEPEMVEINLKVIMPSNKNNGELNLNAIIYAIDKHLGEK